MGNAVNKIWSWLTQGSAEEREFSAAAQVIGELEDTIDELKLKHQQDLDAQHVQRTLLQQEIEEAQSISDRLQKMLNVDALTGFPYWEDFLQEAKELFSGEGKPGCACGICLETVRKGQLYGSVTMGTPESYLASCAEELRSLPQSLFARDDHNRIFGILYGDPEGDFTGRLQKVHSCAENATALLEPIGIAAHSVIVGTAWYPADCDAVEGLLERARLAAYTAKQQNRQGLCPFSEDSADMVLIDGQDAFLELVEHKQVRFSLQPILRSANAKVEGYALVMESRSPKLRRMDKVAAVADFLGRKHELEKLLWFDGMAYITGLVRQGKLLYNSKIWIRSFSGTCLTDREDQAFQEANFDYLKHIVLDLEEKEHPHLAAIKRQRARQWGAKTAVACGGLTPRDEMDICFLQPELVRAKPEIVRGIGKGKKKQAAFAALREYADSHDLPLLAEGIESAADLQMAVWLGATFLQGDYLSKPEATPGEIPERRIEQIGQAQYGKRG